jgi:hypothetical protein
MIRKLSKVLSGFLRGKDTGRNSPLMFDKFLQQKNVLPTYGGKAWVKYTKPKQGLPLTYFIDYSAEERRAEIRRAVKIWSDVGIKIQEVQYLSDAVLIFNMGDCISYACYNHRYSDITGKADLITMRERLYTNGELHSIRSVPKCGLFFGRKRYSYKVAENVRVEIFAHEIGHALGLSDLHDTKEKKNIMYEGVIIPLIREKHSFIITQQQIKIAITLQEFGEEGLIMQDVDTRWILTHS